MNPTSRHVNEEYRTVAGLPVIVFRCEEMNYSGTWEHSGYVVTLCGERIGSFYGYPIDRDIQRVLPKLPKY